MATRAMDGGAVGIVIPHVVNTPQQAQDLVAHLKFLPEGHRSNGGALPHFRYQPTDLPEACQIVNKGMLIVTMLETREAVANAEAIAAVDGIDVLLIGAGDLSLELCTSGNYGHPEFVATNEAVIAACRKFKKWSGIGGLNPEEYLERNISMGLRMIQIGTDLTSMVAGATQRARMLNRILPD